MKGNLLFIIMTLLVSCSTTTAFNKELENKNISVVADGQYLFGIETGEHKKVTLITSMYAYLLKENGINISTSFRNHEIQEGKNKLVVNCQIYFEGPMLSDYKFIYNESFLNVNLKKGHTYNLFPVYINDSKTSKDSCIVEINDVTET